MMTGVIIGTIVIVIISIAIGLLVDRKVPVLPKPDLAQRVRSPAPTYAAGEAPATALRVRGDQLEKLRTSQRCPECRAAMTAGPDDHVRYDAAELVVLHFTCPACPAKRSLYVAAR